MAVVHFFLYPDVQPMDLIGPWEVCATWQDLPEVNIECQMVAAHEGPIRCLNGITLAPTHTFDTASPADYCFIPGGFGRIAQMQNARCLDHIRQQAQETDLLLSVCTGAFLLAEAGVLNDHKATTYWRALPEFRERYPHIAIEEERIVKSGDIWCSGGVSSGIDLALALVAHVDGTARAGEVQLMFEYFPLSDNYATAATPNTVPPYPTKPTCPAGPLPQYIKKLLGA